MAAIIMTMWRGGFRTPSKLAFFLYALLINTLIGVGVVTVALTKLWFVDIALVPLWFMFIKNEYELYNIYRVKWRREE